jgi:hypothetical protein
MNLGNQSKLWTRKSATWREIHQGHGNLEMKTSIYQMQTKVDRIISRQDQAEEKI